MCSAIKNRRPRHTGRLDDESLANLALEMWETKFQLEFVKVPLEAQRILVTTTNCFNVTSSGVENRKFLVDLRAIRSAATPQCHLGPKMSRITTKRNDGSLLLPFRHAAVRQVFSSIPITTVKLGAYIAVTN